VVQLFKKTQKRGGEKKGEEGKTLKKLASIPEQVLFPNERSAHRKRGGGKGGGKKFDKGGGGKEKGWAKRAVPTITNGTGRKERNGHPSTYPYKGKNKRFFSFQQSERNTVLL